MPPNSKRYGPIGETNLEIMVSPIKLYIYCISSICIFPLVAAMLFLYFHFGDINSFQQVGPIGYFGLAIVTSITVKLFLNFTSFVKKLSASNWIYFAFYGNYWNDYQTLAVPIDEIDLRKTGFVYPLKFKYNLFFKARTVRSYSTLIIKNRDDLGRIPSILQAYDNYLQILNEAS